jgi:hypothetical protein
VASQMELFRDWRTAVKYMPVLMALGVGLCVSNTKAIVEALLGKQSEFVRTPKYGGGDGLTLQAGTDQVRRKREWVPYVEFAMGVYMSLCAVLCMFSLRSAVTSPFMVMFAFGFFYVSVMSFQARRVAAAKKQAVEAVEVEA